MEIDFLNETDFVVNKEITNSANILCKLLLEEEGFPLDVEISVTITDNEGIKKLNKKYRDIDKETDVLSFPCYKFTGGDYSLIKKEPLPIALGDIVISYEKAEWGAAEYGHSLLREMSFLICHSLLHLLGYDHIKEADKTVMFKKQEYILTKAGIVR